MKSTGARKTVKKQRSTSPNEEAVEATTHPAKKMELSIENQQEERNESIAAEDVLSTLRTITAINCIDTRSGSKIALVDLKTVYKSEADTHQRLLHIATAPHGEKIFNIARVTVNDFTRTRSGALAHIGFPQAPAVFFHVGITVASSLTHGDRNRHISILPCNLTWPRSAAFIGQICHEKALAFWTWNKGVSFSTMNKTKDSDSFTIATDEEDSPAKSGNPLAWNQNIPCFDGTNPFFLENFWKLPKIDSEIEGGSAVLVLFSVNTYDYRGGLRIKNLNKNASLNAISVVLLAHPPDDFTNNQSVRPSTSYTKKQLGIEEIAEEKTIASTSKGPMM
ncbi:hypothetical protein M405DRAFT_833285 [Rhizopogon salebrosus TDB-379]|nr:hypothetical protein M405DRAFT_833285 [Rhizopogon salebrosus TDB-379]